MSIQEIDAKIYTSTAKLLCCNYESIQLTQHFKVIAGIFSDDLYFTTKNNILNLLLVYTYPHTIQLQVIPTLVEIILEQGEPIDIEEFANSLQCDMSREVLLSTANDLLLDTTQQVKQSEEYSLFSFIQAKTLQLAKYLPIDEISPLFVLKSEDFVQWYKGIVSVFQYYYQYDKSCSFEKYLKLTSLQERFDVLVIAMNENNLRQYMDHVIVPLCTYYQDLTPLKHYMFSHMSGKLSMYKKWFTIIKCVSEYGLKYDDIVEWFVICCYCFAFKQDNLSSIEIIKIYDVIYDTLYLVETPIDIKDTSCMEYIGEDINMPDLTSELFKQIVSICKNLFPITKLTIDKYFKYKQTVDVNRDITKLVSTLNVSNYQQLIPAIRTLQQQFNLDETLLNKLIVERLLACNLFDEVVKYNSKLPQEVFSKLITEKFFYSISHATNFNENIGHLQHCKKCLEIFDVLELHRENRESIIRLKHLFKAINNLNSFNLAHDKKNLLTPQEIFQFKSNLINLITFILQRNPKSYLAFEKLFKIINDLAIYFEIEQDYFMQVKIACVESSLIDDNFEYAYKQSMPLFEKCHDWFIFYQVGKFISPNWNVPPIDVLIKQRNILGLTLKNVGQCNRIVLDQWERINQQIEEYDKESEVREEVVRGGDKFSNLLVSGLGWAIGANQR